MRLNRSAIRGILFDLDGVLFVGESAIPGAAETIRKLKQRGIAMRFITNTTAKHRTTIWNMLRKLGFDVEQHEIITTPGVAASYLLRRGRISCWPVVSDDVRAEFASFEITEDRPQAIVIGDIGPKWDYALMNRLFNMVTEGSEIVALHKGKSWRTEKGLQIDIGAFVAGLEYAAGKTATVIGKPSELFFELAVKAIGLPKSGLIMVGDDIDNDVMGAQQVGLPGILVKTGKYNPVLVEGSSVTPDAVIGSVANIWELLDS